MYIKFADFLNHVEKLTFSTDALLERSDRILRRLDEVKKYSGDISIEKDVDIRLEEIAARFEYPAILCGGGIDSNYLLVKLSELGLRPLVVSAVTTGNMRALESVKVIVEKYGLDWHSKSHENVELEFAINKFYDKFGRLPNDQAMPLVWCLGDYAMARGADAVIDGQFADTVLFANPQNYLFKKTRSIKLPRLLFDSTNIEKRNKAIAGYYYLSLTIEERILFLCRAENSSKSRAFMSSLLGNYESEHVLQCVFYEFLLDVRERDKYRAMSIEVTSPFDDFDYLACSSRSVVRGKKQKKFMVDYIRKHVPAAVALMESKSFEAA